LGITRKKVNWALDPDVRSFFDKIDTKSGEQERVHTSDRCTQDCLRQKSMEQARGEDGY
jgi:hypothetical protein